MSLSTNHPVAKRLFNHRPFRNALIVLTILCIGIGLLIVPVESSVTAPKIHTSEEGLWWAVTTITGVGYGDYVPVSTAGRLLGAVLQISGVVMFGLVIGIVGITLNKRQEEFYWFRLFDRLNQLDEKLDQQAKQLHFLVHAIPRPEQPEPEPSNLPDQDEVT